MARLYSVPDNTLSLRSSSTASMLPRQPKAQIASSSYRNRSWDTPQVSRRQRLVLQQIDKQARHGRVMRRLLGHRLVPGFLR